MNVQEMMKKAKQMQAKLEQIKEEAGNKTVEGSAGGGMVVATANGRSEIVSVKIDPEVVDKEEVEMLQDLVLAATNQALTRAQELMNEEMSKLTGGMNLPGLF
jgi:hypothetical protein